MVKKGVVMLVELSEPTPAPVQALVGYEPPPFAGVAVRSSGSLGHVAADAGVMVAVGVGLIVTVMVLAAPVHPAAETGVTIYG